LLGAVADRFDVADGVGATVAIGKLIDDDGGVVPYVGDGKVRGGSEVRGEEEEECFHGAKGRL
jgi:hypothetical protein